MKTKLNIFLLSLSFLFLFSSFVYGDEPEAKREYYDNGKLKSVIYYKREIKEKLGTYWYESGIKKSTRHFKNGIENGIRKEWNNDGKKTFQGNFVDGNEE